MYTGTWVVNVQGHVHSKFFEISVVRSDHRKGRNGPGGFGPDKHLVATSPYRKCPVLQQVWDGWMVMAEYLAESLNLTAAANSVISAPAAARPPRRLPTRSLKILSDNTPSYIRSH